MHQQLLLLSFFHTECLIHVARAFICSAVWIRYPSCGDIKQSSDSFFPRVRLCVCWWFSFQCSGCLPFIATEMQQGSQGSQLVVEDPWCRSTAALKAAPTKSTFFSKFTDSGIKPFKGSKEACDNKKLLSKFNEAVTILLKLVLY